MPKAEGVVSRIRWLSDEVGGVAALARASCLSRTLVQGVLTRGEEATSKTLAALASGTGVPPEWLANGGPNPKVEIAVRQRARNVADMPPLGLRRSKPGSPIWALNLVGDRVREAISKADPEALGAAIPAVFAAAYAKGIALPGQAHRAAIAEAAGVTEAWLLGEGD